MVEVKGVAECAEVMPLLIFDIHVVKQLCTMGVDVCLRVAEHYGEAAEVFGDDLGRVAGIALGEVVTVLQTAVFGEYGMVENVGEHEAVDFFRGFIAGGGVECQPVKLLMKEVALVARAIKINGEISLPHLLRVRGAEGVFGHYTVGEVDVGIGSFEVVNLQIRHLLEIERVGQGHPRESNRMIELENHILVRLPVDAQRLVHVLRPQQRVVLGDMYDRSIYRFVNQWIEIDSGERCRLRGQVVRRNGHGRVDVALTARFTFRLRLNPSRKKGQDQCDYNIYY